MAGDIEFTPDDIHFTPDSQSAVPVAPPPQPYAPKFLPGEYSGPSLPASAGIGMNDAADVWNSYANPYSKEQLAAAQQGVNVDANAGVGTARANFAATQARRDAVVTQALKAKYGPNIQTRSGPEGLEWYNPKGDNGRGQWQTVGNSLGGAAVNAIPATSEAIGATVGSLTGPFEVGTGALGAGIGRGTGDMLKDIIGMQMYPDDKYPGLWDITKDSARSAKDALFGGLVLSAIPAAIRMSFQGADIVPSLRAGRSILQSFWKNKGLVDQMDAALAAQGKPPMNLSVPRVAMITKNPTDPVNQDAINMADQEPLLRLNNSGRQIAIGEDNKRGVEDFWQNEVRNPYAWENLTQQNWQARLKGIYQEYKDNILGPAQKDVEEAMEKAKAAVHRAHGVVAPYASDPSQPVTAKDGPILPGDLPLAQSGQIIRSTILKHYEDSKSQADEAWAKYQDLAGYRADGVTSPVRVPMTTDMMATQKAFGRLAEGSLLPSQRAQGARYLIDLQPGVNFADQTVDLARLDRTIKDLREEQRYSERGTVSDGMSDNNRKRLLSSLVDMRTQFMQQPGNEELYSALTKAEAETVRHVNGFQRGFIGDFLTRDENHNYQIADPTILHYLLDSGTRGSPDVEGAKQLAGLLNGDPASHSAILDYAHAFYNQRYTKMLKDGTRILDPKLHAKFNEQVMPVLDNFLSAPERAQFRRLGGLANGTIKAKQAFTDAVNTWNNSINGKIGRRLNNETFVGQFFDKRKSFGEQNLSFIRNKLDGVGTGNTDALDITRAGIIHELNDRVRGDDGFLDVDKLHGIYEPLKGRFQAYFGKSFTNNMDMAIPILRAMSRKTNTIPQYEGTTRLSYWVRYGLLGPLSSDNRKLTILENIRTRSYASRLESAMYNPDELQKLVNDLGKWGFRANRARAGVAAGTAADIATRGSSIPQNKQQGQGINTSAY